MKQSSVIGVFLLIGDARERELIEQTLKRNAGKITSAAADLGISRPTLYELMEKLGIAKERANTKTN